MIDISNWIKIVFIGLCIAFSTTGLAQATKGDNEISVSYGIKSGSELIGMTYVYGVYEDGTYYETSHTGNYFAVYRRYVSNKVALGLTVGRQSLAFDYKNTGMKYGYPDFSTKANLTTIAIEIKKVYVDAPSALFQSYWLIGLGTTFFSETQTPKQLYPTRNPILFNSQWSPLCVSFGKSLGVFFEMGFGYKGLVNSGVYYRL